MINFINTGNFGNLIKLLMLDTRGNFRDEVVDNWESDELNRKGSKWDYVVSDPTSSSAYKTEPTLILL